MCGVPLFVRSHKSFSRPCFFYCLAALVDRIVQLQVRQCRSRRASARAATRWVPARCHGHVHAEVSKRGRLSHFLRNDDLATPQHASFMPCCCPSRDSLDWPSIGSPGSKVQSIYRSRIGPRRSPGTRIISNAQKSKSGGIGYIGIYRRQGNPRHDAAPDGTSFTTPVVANPAAPWPPARAPPACSHVSRRTRSPQGRAVQSA